MAWYVVSYDLRRERAAEDYNRLYEALKTAVDFCWPLQSIWVIETPLAPSGVIAALVSVGALDQNDGIVVLEITGKGDFAGVAGQPAADWLNAKITRA